MIQTELRTLKKRSKVFDFCQGVLPAIALAGVPSNTPPILRRESETAGRVSSVHRHAASDEALLEGAGDEDAEKEAEAASSEVSSKIKNASAEVKAQEVAENVRNLNLGTFW